MEPVVTFKYGFQFRLPFDAYEQSSGRYTTAEERDRYMVIFQQDGFETQPVTDTITTETEVGEWSAY